MRCKPNNSYPKLPFASEESATVIVRVIYLGVLQKGKREGCYYDTFCACSAQFLLFKMTCFRRTHSMSSVHV
jgi:hypothetical protein